MVTTAAEAETAIAVALAAASAAVASAKAARADAAAEFYNNDKSSGLVLTNVTKDGNPAFVVSGTPDAMAKATAALSTMREATKKTAKAVADFSIEMTISAILSDVAETYPDVSMTQEYREILKKRLERHVRDLSSGDGCVYDDHMTLAQVVEEKHKTKHEVMGILDKMLHDEDDAVEIAPGIYQLAVKRALDKVRYMPMVISPFIKNKRTVVPNSASGSFAPERAATWADGMRSRSTTRRIK